MTIPPTRARSLPMTLIAAARNPWIALDRFSELVQKASLRERDDEGLSALMITAQVGPAERLPVLLARFSPVTVDHAGKTALAHAVESNNLDAVRVLLPVTRGRRLPPHAPSLLTLAAGAASLPLLELLEPDLDTIREQRAQLGDPNALDQALVQTKWDNAAWLIERLPLPAVHAALHRHPRLAAYREMDDLMDRYAQRQIAAERATLLAVVESVPAPAARALPRSRL